MKWVVYLHDQFKREFDDLSHEVQDQLLAHALLLQEYGPYLGRPYVDTLKGSKFTNMKELKFRADNGVWRVAFAFDPMRSAILLVAGKKSGVSESRFYIELIKKAEERFRNHITVSK